MVQQWLYRKKGLEPLHGMLITACNHTLVNCHIALCRTVILIKLCS